MIRPLTLTIICLLLGSVCARAEQPSEAGAERGKDELARQASGILREFCSKCHGPDVDSSGAGLNVLDIPQLVAQGYLNTEFPEQSILWQRMAEGEMPPLGEPQPSVAQGAALRKWIAAGAPAATRSKRRFISPVDVQSAILDDLRRTPPAARIDRQYFSFANIWNHPDVDDRELKLHIAAFAKALNSVSRSKSIVRPTAVDADGAVFAINLLQLGWPNELWQSLVAAYPYGLHHRLVGDPGLRQLSEEIEALASRTHDLPVLAVRADWFTVTATRPPLYHLLLDIPPTVDELEARLGVNVQENFLNNAVKRSGFAESGVSVANRAVERHQATDGYYWKSFDFLEDRIDGNLFQRPLGPRFDDNPFNQFAFSHDGGEMIFSLPNGLQGYMLTDAQGNRIDEGPIAVVQDAARTAGSPVVVNGISCMNCHAQGTIPFRDTVREGLGLFGEARLKVRQLYAPQEEMDAQLAADSQQFMAALARLLRPYRLTDSNGESSIDDLPEPIGVVARRYHANLGLREAAGELGVKDAAALSQVIGNSPALRGLGLGPLTEGKTVDRAFWHSRRAIVSPMQSLARELDLGTPLSILPPNND